MEITSNEHFVELLELRSFKNDHEKAVYSLHFLEKILCETEWDELSHVLDNIKNFSALVKAKFPQEAIPRNMAVRMIKIIKDEYYAVVQKKSKIEKEDLETTKCNVLDFLQELKAEYEQCQEMISNQSGKMIHSNEVILTGGYCPSTLQFLLRAAKTRKFHVVVAEFKSTQKGDQMAKRLNNAGIKTTFIEDEAVFAYMPRVNQVIFDCSTVFLDGGMKTANGASAICIAARHYAIPVYVCTPTYKFSVLEPEICEFLSSESSECCRLRGLSTKHDIVAPQYIEGYITNERTVAPRHVYRQLKKLYFPLPRGIYETGVSFKDC